MRKLNSYLAKFQNYFLIISSIIIFQAITIYDQRFCYDGEVSTSKCNLIKNSKITIPSKFLIKNLKELNTVVKNELSTSGRIVKNIEDTSNRFNSIKSGFNFYYKKGSRKNAGYLLLSAADPYKDGIPIVELWDMNNQKIIHKWQFKMRKYLSKTGVKLNKNSVAFTHPLLLSDGSLIVNSSVGSTPLSKFSKDGDLLKFNSEYTFHHSLEKDFQEKIYVPIRKKDIQYTDGFAIIDKDLNILETHFLIDIYKKAGLQYDLYSEGATKDPFHLNDVEPLRNRNGTKFVLLSLAHQSSIIAYDIEKRKVIWVLRGFAVKQHDPDFLNNEGSYISIFDNNRLFPSTHFEPGNKVNNNIYTTIKNLPSLNSKDEYKTIIYNKASSHNYEKNLELSYMNFNFLKENLIPRTVTEGLSDKIANNNSIFIEETNYGRLLEIDFKEKKLLWEYINKNNDEIYFMMAWSRRLKEIPTFTLQKLRSKNN